MHLAHRVLDDLGYVGILCVEFFVTADGRLLVNEIAPRPHNSGHFTIDACVTSQFEQHVRAVCGLSLGDTTQVKPAAMVNLLGDLWINGEPDWAAALAVPDVKLHLYGKADARVGRKMGHITALGGYGRRSGSESARRPRRPLLIVRMQERRLRGQRHQVAGDRELRRGAPAAAREVREFDRAAALRRSSGR